MQQGEADLLAPLTRTPERETFLDYSSAYLSVPNVLIVNRTAPPIRGFADLAGKIVGVAQNSGAHSWLQREHPEVVIRPQRTPRGAASDLSKADRLTGGLGLSLRFDMAEDGSPSHGVGISPTRARPIENSLSHPMIRKAFVMSVNPGSEAEYERRHRPIWAELEQVLKSHGAHNYSIFLHPETRQLFGYVEIEDEARWAAIAATPVCQRWWKHMGDVMPSNPDHSPVAQGLREVFHLE